MPWKWRDNIRTRSPKKVYVGSFHDGLVHEPVSIEEAMKIPEAKAAVDKEWSKFKTIPSETKVRKKSHRQAKKDGRAVHFANGMDRCHLKNAELAKHLKKYKEQGASASQMAAAKFLNTLWKLPGMAGETSDALSAYAQVNWPKLPDCYQRRKKNACHWQELDDQIHDRQLTLWHDQ